MDKPPKIDLQPIGKEKKVEMTISNNEFKVLLSRAGAISADVKSEVADLALEGKNYRELSDFILDKAVTSKNDADADDLGDKNSESAIRTKKSKFEEIDDDDFFRSISNPREMLI